MEIGENEWLTDIRKQSTRLASLTSDLIYLARMEERRNTPHTDFPLSDAIEEVVISFSSLAKTKKITPKIEKIVIKAADQKRRFAKIERYFEP